VLTGEGVRGCWDAIEAKSIEYVSWQSNVILFITHRVKDSVKCDDVLDGPLLSRFLSI
jgi:hypothetical protein